jgi:hypothetical protein
VLPAPGVQLAEEGSTVDIAVSTGQPASLQFQVSNPSTFSWAKGNTLEARLTLSLPADVTATLTRHGQQLRKWQLHEEAGVSKASLRMPAAARTAGVYTIAWTARASGQSASRMTHVRVLPPSRHTGTAAPPAPPAATAPPAVSPPALPAPVAAHTPLAAPPAIPVPSAPPVTHQAVVPRPTTHHLVRPKAPQAPTLKQVRRALSPVVTPAGGGAKAGSDRVLGGLLGVAAVLLLGAFFLSLGAQPVPVGAGRAFVRS